MPANNETRVIKTNTFEDWRQKGNEVSFELGDVDQLDSRILDKNHSWTASADQSIFQNVAHRFEIAPEHVTDMNVIIFTGLSSIPSNFVVGNTVTQSGGFSGKILWINKNKVALELTSGTFNAGQNLVQGGQNIPHANIVRQIVESVKVGYARVKVQGTEISQSQIQAGWHAANYDLSVTLSGSPTIPSTFTEGATLYQGSVGSESFTGTLLYADSSTLYFKNHTGTFNTGIMVKQSETSGDRIVGGGLSAATAADTSFLQLIELHTQSSANDAVLLIANSAVLAINEVQDDIGDITSLGTTDKADLVTAINELETAARGSTANYTINTTSNDIIGALNEHDAELGTITAGAMGTTASTVSGAIAELEAEIDVLNTRVEPTQAFAGSFSSSTVMDALNEHETDIGNMTLTGLAATDISAALREIRVDIGNVGNSGATLTTGTNIAATDLTAAVVELDSTIGSGVITGAGTEAVGAGSLTTAVNLLNTALGDSDSYNDGTYGANTIAGTLDLLQAGMIANDTDIAARLIKVSGSSQTLETDLSFGGNKTYTVTSGSTLDVSNGTLLLPGNASGINTFSVSFLNVDGNQASTGMGMRIDRAHISGAPTPYPAVQWRESQVGASKGHRGWQIVGTNANGSSSVTSDLLTFYNAEELFTNNVETGLAVTWDSTNQNFDVVLDNSTFTLTGDVTGTATQTAKGNVSIATTIAANSVALGTDTTGDYIGTITGTANEITVTGSGTEDRDVTIALPDDVTIGNNLVVTDYARAAGLRVGTSGADPGDNNMAVAGNAEVGGNLTVTGNFTVNGTTTTLSTTNLEVEDTLILAGSDLGNTEPNTGGFGIETKQFAGTHSNAAAGVTGAHSLVYNFATDRWEADGSLVLSAATVGSPAVKHSGGSSSDLEQDDTLIFTTGASGQGVSVAVSKSSNDLTALITNTDKGSSQNIFKQMKVGGTTVSADNNNDIMNFTSSGSGLINLTLSNVGNNATLNIDHDLGSMSDIDLSGGNVIQDLDLTHGHIVGYTAIDLDGRYYQESEFTSANTASKPVIRDGSGNFSAGTITADLSGNATTSSSTTGNAATATKVRINATSASGDYRIVFRDGGNTTANNLDLYSDAGGDAHYNPSTNTLTAGTFSGSHSGNGSSLTSLNASNISSGTINDARLPASISSDITGNSATTSKVYVNSAAQNASYRMVFTETNDTTNANKHLYQDTGAGIYYNPSTNTLNVGTIVGNGTQLVNLDASNISQGTINDARLPATISSNITGSSASCTGNALTASQVYVTANASTNTNYYPTFIGTNSSANKAMQFDSSMYYNPNSNTLVVPNITATLTGSSTSCTGNAATVTNGVYTTGTQTISGTKTFNATISGSINGNAATASDVYQHNSDGNGNYRLLWTTATSAGNDNVYHTGGITLNASSNIVNATDFIASSDERLKTKVGTLDNALDKVCSIDGFLYTWNDKAQSKDKETVQVGVSAQQVQEVLPEAVAEGEEGYLGVKYDKLVPLLIESIKELKAEIEELKSINR